MAVRSEDVATRSPAHSRLAIEEDAGRDTAPSRVAIAKDACRDTEKAHMTTAQGFIFPNMAKISAQVAFPPRPTPLFHFKIDLRRN